MAIECREIAFQSAEYEREIDLRFRVLRKPLGMILDPEQLSLEGDEWHIGAFEEGQLVGCLILVPKPGQTAKMRAVAVEPDRQGKGVGRSMVQFSEQFLLARSIGFIELNARETAIPFYLSLGYSVEGPEFIEVGIPHRRMVKALKSQEP